LRSTRLVAVAVAWAVAGPAEAGSPAGDESDPAPVDTDDDVEPSEPEPEPEPEPESDAPVEPVPPSRSVWASPEEPAPRPAAVVDPAPPPAAAPPRDPKADELDDGPIGGYLHVTETKELPPPTGERKLLAAYILLPLGTLATITGAVSTWVTDPDHCQERLGKLASSIDQDSCPGLHVLNIIRTTYGSLMIASGAVLLGIGLRDKKRHREWKARHHSRVVPALSPRGAGIQWSLRF
jgi:hypothetical protein